MSTQAPVRAAKYRRISQDREGRELGVQRQDDDLDDLAARKSYVIVADYCDNDISASTRSRKPRKAYRRMIDDAKAGSFDVIIAYTSKRLTRKPRENEDLIELAERYGIRYDYVRSPSFDLNTANGRMIARMLAAQDCNESEEMGERVSAARKQRATRGGNGGGGSRPYGREVDGITIRESEAEEMRRWVDFVLSDGTYTDSKGRPQPLNSLGFIAADMRKRGIPTVSGKPWAPSTIRDILLRPSNAGIRVHKGRTRHPLDENGAWIGEVGRWEDVDGKRVGPMPIFDEDTLKAVVKQLTAPERRTASGNVPRWLGSGIYVCGVCGQADLRVSMSGSRPAPRYRCHVARPAYELDAYVEREVINRLSLPDAVDLIASRTPDVDTHALNREAQTIRTRQDQFAFDYSDGLLTREQFKAIRDRDSARLAEIDRQLMLSSGRSPLTGIAGADDAYDRWETLSLGRRRAILRELCTVTVLPVGRGRGNQPLADSVVIEFKDAS